MLKINFVFTFTSERKNYNFEIITLLSDSDNKIIICWNIPRHCFHHFLVINNSEDLRRDTPYIRQNLVSSPRFPFGDNNQDRWGTRSSHVSQLRPFRRWMVLAPPLRARPLSRERSKSKSTSQPIVNTGTTGEFNSIRTRSSDCSIVRHRIPPARSCGPYPLYLSLPPFRPLACNPQHSPLTLPWSPYALCERAYMSVETHMVCPSSLVSIYLSDFTVPALRKPKCIRRVLKISS